MTSNCSRCVRDMRGCPVLISHLLPAPEQPTPEVFRNGSALRNHFALHSGTVLVDITDTQLYDLARPYDNKIAIALASHMLVCTLNGGLRISVRHCLGNRDRQRPPTHPYPRRQSHTSW